ncbi:DUF2254 domain-containing protein (plasmid) [Paracoccus sp. AK26]|nr:DUF2254 domain-containing protein [Paracoccus sp. AK26]
MPNGPPWRGPGFRLCPGDRVRAHRRGRPVGRCAGRPLSSGRRLRHPKRPRLRHLSGGPRYPPTEEDHRRRDHPGRPPDPGPGHRVLDPPPGRGRGSGAVARHQRPLYSGLGHPPPFGGLARPDGSRGSARVFPDDQGQVRVICPVPTYATLLNASFSQIRQSGTEKPLILIHLLKAFAAMAPCARTEEQRSALQDQVHAVLEDARRAIPNRADLDDVEQHGLLALHDLKAR